MEMKTKTNTGWLSKLFRQGEPPPGEENSLKHTFTTVSKHIREASSCAAVIAGINILIGALIPLFFDFVPDWIAQHPTDSLLYSIAGLVYLILGVGIYKRSRVCAILAMLAFSVDSIAFFVLGGLENFSVGTLMMRGAFFLAFGYGVRYCFKFHALVKEHEASFDSEVAELVSTKPKMTALRRVVYAILALIGIGGAILAFTSDGGHNFENWTSHQEGAITMRIPSARVTEERTTDPAVPGLTFVDVHSFSRGAEVVLVRTEGAQQLANVQIGALDFLAYSMLRGGAEMLTDRLDGYSGAMQGTSYQALSGLYRDRHPFEFRALVIDGNVYLVGIIVSREANADLIPQFFDSIVIDTTLAT